MRGWGQVAKRKVTDTPELRSLRARMAAHESWAHTEDRTARTDAARAAFFARFEREVDPDGVLGPQERHRRALSARKAYYARLAYRSAQSRARRRGRAADPGEDDGARNDPGAA